MTASETKRILFVIDTLDVGGAERYLTRIIKYLRQKEPAIGCYVATLLPAKHSLRGAVEEAGATVTHIDRPVRDPRLWSELAQLMRSLRPDLVQSFLWTADNVAAWAARRAGIALRVGSELGNRKLWEMRAAPLRLFARMVDQRLAFPGAACFVSNASFGADHLIAWGLPPEKVRVIHAGVETPPAPPAGWDARAAIGAPQNARLIGCAARLIRIKRVDLLIRALKALRDEGREVVAVVMGDGPERAALERLARDLGLGAAAKFLGMVDRPNDYFHSMDVCVLCSETDLFPNAILEAMACGRPVVASRVGGIPEMIDDGRTGLLFERGDLGALVSAIRRILDDGNLARRLGGAARLEVLKRFSADKTFEAYRRLYRELLFPNRETVNKEP